MKTILQKSYLLVITLLITSVCHSQIKSRIAYEYVLEIQDSSQHKKEMKLQAVREERYSDIIPAINTQNNSSAAIKVTRPEKDKNYSFQYSYGKKSITIKKFDKSTQALLSVTNKYFGNSNKMYNETIFDKKNNCSEAKYYLYSRQGRLAKVVTYINGKISSYIFYEYRDEK